MGKDLPVIERHGQEYFLLGHQGALYLLRNQCPHRGGPLKFGFINACGQLVCPMHHQAFAIDTLLEQASTIRLLETPGGAS